MLSDGPTSIPLLHGREATVLGDSGYIGAGNRTELEGCKAAFLIAAKRSMVKLIKNARERKQVERWETCKSSMRAKVEHPFRVIKRQFGYAKVPLSRFGQEHVPGAHAVRTIQPVDGTPAAAAHHRVSAHFRRRKLSKGPETGRYGSEDADLRERARPMPALVELLRPSLIAKGRDNGH